jgi:hypothetical protein
MEVLALLMQFLGKIFEGIIALNSLLSPLLVGFLPEAFILRILIL